MIALLGQLALALGIAFLAGGLIGWAGSRLVRPRLVQSSSADDTEGPTMIRAAATREVGSQDVAAEVPTPPAVVPLRLSTPDAVLPPGPRSGPLTIDAVPIPRVFVDAPAPRDDQQPRVRPPVLAGPRRGRADMLQRIEGLSRRHAERLHAIGIYHFSQIAAWTPREIAWVAAYLDVGDMIVRLDWVGKATRLATMDGPARPPRR